ncbi:MAG: alpha/beta hydrolase [Pseudomonadota bacterium]
MSGADTAPGWSPMALLRAIDLRDVGHRALARTRRATGRIKGQSTAPLQPFGHPGDGPPILMIHGLLESPAIWRPVLPLIKDLGGAGGFLPLPGHTPWTHPDLPLPSEDGGSAYFEAMIAAYAARLQRIGRPVRLVGHSTGGLIALALAARHPTLVRDVLLIGALFAGHRGRDTGPLETLLSAPYLGPASFHAMVTSWASTPARFRQGVTTASAQPLPHSHTLHRMRRDVLRANLDAVYQFGQWLYGADLTACLEQVTCPVLSLLCTKDPVVTPAHQLDLLGRLPRGRAVLLNSGHLPMLEDAPGLAMAIRHWAAT